MAALDSPGMVIVTDGRGNRDTPSLSPAGKAMIDLSYLPASHPIDRTGGLDPYVWCGLSHAADIKQRRPTRVYSSVLGAD